MRIKSLRDAMRSSQQSSYVVVLEDLVLLAVYSVLLEQVLQGEIFASCRETIPVLGKVRFTQNKRSLLLGIKDRKMMTRKRKRKETLP